jgi:phospholipid/cholesterol/gamma-HCH transport system substrate-binding protein
MTPRRLLEIKVGAFIVVGIGLLVFFIFAIGDFSSYFQSRYELRVRFDSANGIASGSPVKYAGVEKGKVNRVELITAGSEHPYVEIHVNLPSSIAIRQDDLAKISTLGLLGEMFLGITPGPQQAPVIGPGGVLVGVPPVSTEDLLEDSNDVLNELKQTLTGLNTMVGDEEARTYLREALHDARDAMRNWKVLGERLNLAMWHIESGKGNLGKMMFDDELYRSAIGFVEDLKSHPWKLLARPKTGKKPREN